VLALLQITFGVKTVLLRVNAPFGKGVAGSLTLPPLLSAVLASQRVLKVGVGVAEDAENLFKACPSLCSPPFSRMAAKASYVELNKVFANLNPGVSTKHVKSLTSLCEQICSSYCHRQDRQHRQAKQDLQQGIQVEAAELQQSGKPHLNPREAGQEKPLQLVKDKAVTCSDWTQPSLSVAQVLYGAADSYYGYLIFVCLWAQKFSPASNTPINISREMLGDFFYGEGFMKPSVAAAVQDVLQQIQRGRTSKPARPPRATRGARSDKQTEKVSNADRRAPGRYGSVCTVS